MLTVFAGLSAFGSEGAQDRAKAEGTVIFEMLKERSDMVKIVTVDLPTHEVALIRQAVPELAKMLLSTAEAGPPRKVPRSRAEISLSVIKIDSIDATILAGTPLIGLSGSRDRFILKRKGGRWQIVRRDRNYEMAQNHLTNRWSRPMAVAKSILMS
jgi:hypothetical protein